MQIDGEVLTDATTGLWDLSTKLQAEHKATPEQVDSPVWAVAYTCTVTAPIGAIYPGETHFTIEKQTRDWMAESWVASRRGAKHGK